MYSAFYFLGGFVDLFLAVMLWLILDSEKKPMFFVDGDRVYTVEDVIKVRNSSTINEDCDREQEDVRSTTELYASSLGIS
jgi:hypothetical protein